MSVPGYPPPPYSPLTLAMSRTFSEEGPKKKKARKVPMESVPGGKRMKQSAAVIQQSEAPVVPVVPEQKALLAPEDIDLKAQLSDRGFTHVSFQEWAQQPEGTHTCYTTPKDYLNPQNGQRKRVYAVLGKHIENGRECQGYKSERASWQRTDFPTVRYYVKMPSSAVNSSL
jgi:hypothetical protein